MLCIKLSFAGRSSFLSLYNIQYILYSFYLPSPQYCNNTSHGFPSGGLLEFLYLVPSSSPSTHLTSSPYKPACDSVPFSFLVWKKRWVQIGYLQLICSVIRNLLSFYRCKNQILNMVKGYKHPGYNSLLCLSIKASKISDIQRK